ncbi:anthranilate phosphoribosyltransferase [Crateriforma conspicua]|uniref:Anthranilate phosphoribosyltransferase n=1 Tax=Crateriforma conspicua TaxID=2527996 RepID=A0A5C5YC85_9PLAN|nr:anthranilate phosphoribosyltransferase [Crateriforma conspicua]TWT72393.1 Anthranilate phosphoribosyltransferase 2 [Crateriforma conspicua]
MTTFDDAIRQASASEDLSADQTSNLIDAMLRGDADSQSVADLLMALRKKGESVSELVGAARAMRRHMTPILHRHPILLDTCGTGGSGSGTFNISTAVAILAAACGVPVAKHGNRKATSHSGSADVLEELGVKIESDAESVAKCLDEIDICFCFAAKLHPAMKHVVSVRRSLGVPTLFNLLGPLCNPAGATHQLLGTSTPLAQQKIAAALAQLGTQRAFVIHAEDGQDEVSLEGVTHVVDVRDHSSEPLQWTAASFGFPPCGVEALAAKDPAESARIIRAIFEGQPGPRRDTVVAGAAAALVLVGRMTDVREAADTAAAAIDDGGAMKKLQQLIDIGQGG